MMVNYRVRVSQDSLVFSAGHFITLDGGTCERIHGHNYRLAVEVEDELDENSYVFDFIALRDMARSLVAEFDHRMLLPSRSFLIAVAENGRNIEARFEDRIWSFPAEECVLVPVPNTTAELLAEYVGTRLLAEFAARGIRRPRRLRIELEESVGLSVAVDLIPDRPT